MTGIVETKSLNLQFNSYIDFLRDVKKSSENTVMAYVRDISKFMDYAHTHSIVSVSDIDVEDVEDYKNSLIAEGLSASSSSRALSSLRSFLAYMISVGELTNNPAKSVRNEKQQPKSMSVLTTKEVELLLSMPSVDDPKGIRDKSMLEILYATGIKVSELINLNVEDVNLQIGFIRCGSGDKERTIPLYPLALKYLSNYLTNYRKLIVYSPDENALFVNIVGERMTRQGFWKILKSYADKANIKKDITPHTIRHSFAAHLLENGADIHDIQQILGHTDTASTRRYAEFLRSRMQTGIIKFHPHA